MKRRHDRTEDHRFSTFSRVNYYQDIKVAEIKRRERKRFIRRKIATYMLFLILSVIGVMAVMGLFDIASLFVR